MKNKENFNHDAFFARIASIEEKFSKIKDNEFLKNEGLGAGSTLDGFFEGCMKRKANSYDIKDDLEWIVTNYTEIVINSLYKEKIEILEKKEEPRSKEEVEKELLEAKKNLDEAVAKRSILGREKQALKKQVGHLIERKRAQQSPNLQGADMVSD